MVSLDLDALRMIAGGDIGKVHEHMNRKIEEVQRKQDVRREWIEKQDLKRVWLEHPNHLAERGIYEGDKGKEHDIKEWIKSNIDLTLYEHNPLKPRKAAELLAFVKDAAAKDKDADPIEVLKKELNEYFFTTFSDWESEKVYESAENLAKTFDMDLLNAMRAILSNTSVSYPIDALLEDTYKTVVMVNTGIIDYNLLVAKNLSTSGIYDALVWLAEQNGYSNDEFVHFITHIDEVSKKEHPFIHSVYQELKNNDTIRPNGVTFLGKMSLADLAKAQKEGVTVPKRTVCGLFNHEYGCGSSFKIELQKDIVIPKDIIYAVLPDVCYWPTRFDYHLNYSVDYVYGFPDKVWDTPFLVGSAKEFKSEQDVKMKHFERLNQRGNGR